MAKKMGYGGTMKRGGGGGGKVGYQDKGGLGDGSKVGYQGGNCKLGSGEKSKGAGGTGGTGKGGVKR